MTSLPNPPKIQSSALRPCISSSPSLPSNTSPPSVPESRPPLGQPGTSFVVKTVPSCLKVRVPSHRASSDAVASVCPCSSCGASERTPAQPTTTTAIRKAPTTAMRCAWRITAHPLALACILTYLHLGACHTPKPGASLRRLIHRLPRRRILGSPYTESCISAVL